MPEPSLLRTTDVCARCAIGRSSLFAMVARNEFPRPVKVLGRRIAFVESEVTAWLTQRLAERDAKKEITHGPLQPRY